MTTDDDMKKKKSKIAKKKETAKPWTAEENARLREAVAKYKNKNWKAIAALFPERSEVQCLQRWRSVLHPGVIKGKGSWTKEEDEKLKALVEKYGWTRWSFIGSHLPGRIGKQCRERWHNHLNPDLSSRPWTVEEERIIIEQREKLGNKWARIARMLPGRSDNSVKNRWYASLRKRTENGKPLTAAPVRKKKTAATKKQKQQQKKKQQQQQQQQQQQKQQQKQQQQKQQQKRRKKKGGEAKSIALPPRKRLRTTDASGGRDSGKSTPVRPQHSSTIRNSPMLAFAAYLAADRKDHDAAFLLAGLGGGGTRSPFSPRHSQNIQKDKQFPPFPVTFGESKHGNSVLF